MNHFCCFKNDLQLDRVYFLRLVLNGPNVNESVQGKRSESIDEEFLDLETFLSIVFTLFFKKLCLGFDECFDEFAVDIKLVFSNYVVLKGKIINLYLLLANDY